jgi:hypothetical protein
MPKIIITAEVQDPAKWEAGFRSHGEVFRSYSVNAPISYTTDGNRVAVCMEVASVETMQRQMSLPAWLHPRRPLSGHITCYEYRTYYAL